MVTVADFNLFKIKDNHLPEWISGYVYVTCAEYKCPAGYKLTECSRWGPTATPVIVKCERIGAPPHNDAPPPHSDIPPHSDAPPHSDVPLPPTTANITFSSSPKGAKVRVDGVVIGNT